MPFHSTTIFTLAYLLPLSLAHLPQQKYNKNKNLPSSITKQLLTHILAFFWRKQSCLIGSMSEVFHHTLFHQLLYVMTSASVKYSAAPLAFLFHMLLPMSCASKWYQWLRIWVSRNIRSVGVNVGMFARNRHFQTNYWCVTITATNQNGHNWNSHKTKRPQTGTATRDDNPVYCKAHV